MRNGLTIVPLTEPTYVWRSEKSTKEVPETDGVFIYQIKYGKEEYNLSNKYTSYAVPVRVGKYETHIALGNLIDRVLHFEKHASYYCDGNMNPLGLTTEDYFK